MKYLIVLGLWTMKTAQDRATTLLIHTSCNYILLQISQQNFNEIAGHRNCDDPRNTCLKDILFFDDINCSHSFFYVIISREYLKQSILSRVLCVFHNTNTSYPLCQVDCVCFKGTVLNAEKHLQPPIVNFTAAIAGIHVDMDDFHNSYFLQRATPLEFLL